MYMQLCHSPLHLVSIKLKTSIDEALEPARAQDTAMSSKGKELLCGQGCVLLPAIPATTVLRCSAVLKMAGAQEVERYLAAWVHLCPVCTLLCDDSP